MNILVDGQTLQTPEVNRGIGIYFKNVLNNMVKQSFVHNWYISVGDRACLSALDPWVAERLIPVEHKAFSPGSDYGRTTIYTEKLNEIVKEMNIDVFWCPNPLMVNVLFLDRPLNCRMYATLYDIIPVVLPVKEWNARIQSEYNGRLEFLKQGAVNLFCISHATKTDFEKYADSHPAMYVTSLAADSQKFYRRRQESKTTKDVSIVFVGGFDYRKNMEGALQAFAKACKKYKGNQLIDRATLNIVCNAPQEMQERFYRAAGELGVRDKVVLTGFISDQELAELYYRCDLFFFPSLYEGFGLPILEAMLSGAYVLSADNSSLPEVCEEHAMFCNANDIDDMADKLMDALIASDRETLTEKQQRQAYALTFSWQKTARETLKIFEHDNEFDIVENGIGARKKKIAIITPWPEQETGIANYVNKLVPYLAEYFDIDIFVDNLIKSDGPFLENRYGGLYMLEELDRRYHDYDQLLYQMGNNPLYHSGVHQYLMKYPGIAEIHDYVLHHFYFSAYFLKGKKDAYRTALVQGYQDAGLRYYEKIQGNPETEIDFNKFPMSHSVAAVSKKVLFHNHWSKVQLKNANVDVIPHACFDKEVMPENEQRQLIEETVRKYKLRESEILISCFGFVSSNKRPEVVLQAIRRLRDRGYRVKCIFWGKSGMDGLEKIIQQLGLSDVVHLTGYLKRQEYETGLVLSDIVINLRYPSMGESSGTLCEALKYGKPVIVTEINQFEEFPDEVCWKVPLGDNEVDCLTEMTAYLIEHPEARRALGNNAQNYANEVLAPAKIAQQYFEILK